jgi:hypothetical protein
MRLFAASSAHCVITSLFLGMVGIISACQSIPTHPRQDTWSNVIQALNAADRHSFSPSMPWKELFFREMAANAVASTFTYLADNRGSCKFKLEIRSSHFPFTGFATISTHHIQLLLLAKCIQRTQLEYSNDIVGTLQIGSNRRVMKI